MTSIKDWLHNARTELTGLEISTAKLDAELILADALHKDRAWLIAHAEDLFDPAQADAALARRLNREPLAYIRGYKEFYGRNFTVTPDTLIPRPETETLIELLKPLINTGQRLVDIGTGSGAIAITAKLEYPELTVEATDVSDAALEVAGKNATALGADVSFYTSDLLENVSGSYDIICANLPYVNKAWQVSAETHAEPDLALYAEAGGLLLIKKLIEQATDHLRPQGYLFLEADPRQHDEIVTFGHDHGFDWYQTEGFIVVLQQN